jgi:hypothetical protein
MDSGMDGSIPSRRWQQVCIESCFDVQAKNKILEIVHWTDAEQYTGFICGDRLVSDRIVCATGFVLNFDRHSDSGSAMT